MKRRSLGHVFTKTISILTTALLLFLGPWTPSTAFSENSYFFEWLNLSANPSDGRLVTTVQKRLIDMGYLYGVADGISGIQTQSAILKFKESHDLEPLDSNIDLDFFYTLCENHLSDKAELNDNIGISTYFYWQYMIETTDNRGDMYDLYVDTLRQYKSLKSQGKTGTKTFAEIKEFLIPEGHDEDSYIKAMQKYFTSDDSGIWTFCKTISKRTDGAVLRYWEDGDSWYWQITDTTYGIQTICMASELDFLHTEAILGKLLDAANEYASNPFSLSWDAKTKRIAEASMEN